MKVFWSRCGHGYGNFGDKLTPLLLDYLDIRYRWAPPEDAELIGIGSLLEKIPDNYKGVVWTTGCMFENTVHDLSQAEVLALRGKLTLVRTVGSSRSNIALGDGGLLCDLFSQSTEKKFKLGMIPHFADQQNPIVSKLAEENPDITIIDICAPMLEVIQRVGECERILSSSLHGLILADSLNIPNQWIEFGAASVSGSGFKYRDYYSNFGLNDVRPLHLTGSEAVDDVMSKLTNYSRPGIDRLKCGLKNSLARLAERFGGHMAKTKSLTQLRKEEVHHSRQREQWNHQVHSAVEMLKTILPASETFILVDEEQLRSEITHATAIPFLERNGAYWGVPDHDDEAIAELKRVTAQGVRYIVFAWPAFWWLESYPAFWAYLQKAAKPVMRNETFWIFKIDSGQV